MTYILQIQILNDLSSTVAYTPWVAVGGMQSNSKGKAQRYARLAPRSVTLLLAPNTCPSAPNTSACAFNKPSVAPNTLPLAPNNLAWYSSVAPRNSISNTAPSASNTPSAVPNTLLALPSSQHTGPTA